MRTEAAAGVVPGDLRGLVERCYANALQAQAALQLALVTLRDQAHGLDLECVRVLQHSAADPLTELLSDIEDTRRELVRANTVPASQRSN